MLPLGGYVGLGGWKDVATPSGVAPVSMTRSQGSRCGKPWAVCRDRFAVNALQSELIEKTSIK
jgi:hypothetical protein